MELRKKFRILSWAMVLLVVFNVSIFITILIQHRNRAEFHQPPFVENFNGPPQHGNKPHHNKHFKQMIIKELNLNSDQVEEFDEYRQDFIHKSHVCFDSLKFYNDIIDDELAKENPNNEIIELNAQKIGNFHSNLKLNFVDYYINIKSILNESQYEKFHTILVDFKKQRNRNHNNSN